MSSLHQIEKSERKLFGRVIYKTTTYELLRRTVVKEYVFEAYPGFPSVPISAERAESFDIERGEILECLSSLRETFIEPSDEKLAVRQIAFHKLKDSLANLRDEVSKERSNFLRVMVGLVDAIENLESEALTEAQVDRIQFAFRSIHVGMTEQETKELLDSLVDVGLRPIPSLEGMAELYI